MNASIGAFNLSNAMPTILDLCVAPGGFVKYVLQINPLTRVDAFSLLEQQGGHKRRIPFRRADSRVSVNFQDVTLFADEFGLPDIFKDPRTRQILHFAGHTQPIVTTWSSATDKFHVKTRLGMIISSLSALPTLSCS